MRTTMAVWLAARQVRLRRADRRDLAAVQALVAGGAAGDRRTRFDRRLFADLGGDVYVAETTEPRVVGVVAVSYVRSLAGGRFMAVLDTLCAEAGQDALLGAMADFAEQRARRRGCRQVLARPGVGETAAGAVLRARGWGPGATLTRALADPD
jgi:hypothetical protein